MKFAYYPGCSSNSTAIEYNESVEDTAQRLGIDLEEIPDWNCCGASSGHIIDHELAISLPSLNIALGEKMSLDITTPCPSCFLRLKTAQTEVEKDPNLKSRIEDYIGMPLQLSSKVKHILEVFYSDVGIDTIQKKVQKSLTGLKAVMYYGCYLVRPPEVTEFDNPENPIIMDRIMEALGVQVIDWSYKVDCCGGGLSLTSPEIVKTLVSKLVAHAAEVDADAIITACHLCHANLDIYQQQIKTPHLIPIFYFSELTALSLGILNTKTWFEKHMVSPFGLLERLKLA